jgi:hypothetical protein
MSEIELPLSQAGEPGTTTTGAQPGTQETLRRPRRVRRRFRVLVAVLVAIPLTGLGSDYGARVYAESKTAQAFQAAAGTASAPKVHIRGFPFLTQIARGTLDQVDVSAKEIPAGTDSPVPISKLDAHMTKLKRNADANTAHAGSATATAFISYQDLTSALGLEVKAGPAPGQITASLSAPLVGDISVDAELTKDGPTTIAFKVLGISAANLPEFVRNSINKTFQQKIPLQNLPQGLTLDRIFTESSGISVELSGHDVTFKTSDTSGTSGSSGTSANSGSSGSSDVSAA